MNSTTKIGIAGTIILGASLILSGTVINDNTLTTYNQGVYESTPVEFSGDVYGGTVSFDVSKHTDPNVEIEIEIWLSNDNGVTWDFGGSIKRKGGVGYDPITHEPLTKASFGSFIARPTYFADDKFNRYQPKWTNPLIKTITKITGGTLETKITLDTINSIATQANVPNLHHSITVVQSVQAFSSNSTPVTTAAITTSSGSLVILDTYNYDNDNALSLSDNKSNSWTNSVPVYGSVVYGRQYYNANITGGSNHTFTATKPTPVAPYITINATEVTGHAASPLDKTGTVDDASGTSHSTSATGTLSQAAELVMGMGGAGSTATLSVSGAWTQLQNLSHDGTREGQIVAYQIVSSTASLTFDWTTSASVIAGGHISTWKQAGATATPNIPTVQIQGQTNIQGQVNI